VKIMSDRRQPTAPTREEWAQFLWEATAPAAERRRDFALRARVDSVLAEVSGLEITEHWDSVAPLPPEPLTNVRCSRCGCVVGFVPAGHVCERCREGA
jgi:hypothetical protein